MKKLIFSLFLLILFVFNCAAQSYKFVYRDIPSNLSRDFLVFQSIDLQYFEDISRYFSKRDGSEDYTELLQSLINKYRKIIIPNFPILINKRGLTIPSNSEVYFQNKSKIILERNNQTNYQIFRLHNVKNVKLHNPNIVGDRKRHFGKGGEWGMGLSIVSSSNIEIYNVQISDCWGDGIYIAGKSNKVLIKFGVINNNRRNNVSIVSVDGLSIDKVFLANANGTNPQCGILFEPNKASDIIDNVSVRNVLTYNNAFSGIGFTLKYAYSNTNSFSTIVIDSPVDYYSKYSFSSELSPNKEITNNNRFKITLNNPVWYDSFDFIRTDNYYSRNIEIKLNNVIMRKRGNKLSLSNHKAFKNRVQKNSISIGQ